mmetsp:Transcript_9452/g.57679  ORF Transcript_9452/g.57679 Transcript_9452/m.57679 type:complete len:108 (+) Transcript_9452:1704-2027(+)
MLLRERLTHRQRNQLDAILCLYASKFKDGESFDRSAMDPDIFSLRCAFVVEGVVTSAGRRFFQIEALYIFCICITHQACFRLLLGRLPCLQRQLLRGLCRSSKLSSP